MGRKLIIFSALFVTILTAFVISACDDSTSSDSGDSTTYSFKFDAECPSGTDGRTVYIAAKVGGDCDSGTVRAQASGIISGGEVSITINVPAGSYIGCALIDMDNSGGSGPTNGDYVLSGGTFTVPDDTGVDVDDDDDWDLYSGGASGGSGYTFTFYGEHSGIDDMTGVGIKLIDPEDDCATGDALYEGSYVMYDGEVEIELTGVAAGTYTGCGLIDVDGNGFPSNGDYYIASPAGALTVPDDSSVLIEEEDWIYIP